MISQQQRLQNEVLSRGLDDIVQFAEVISVAYNILGINDDAVLRDEVETCCRLLVDGGLAIFGDLASEETDSGTRLSVTPWLGDGSAVTREIERRWKRLHRWPDLNEIGWLSLTDRGVREAKIRDSERSHDS